MTETPEMALRALADPTRIAILRLVGSKELRASAIAEHFETTRPAISQHLKTLKTAKLVTVKTDKQKRIYSLDPEGVGEVSDWVARITAFWNPRLDALEAALKKDSR